MSPGFWLHHAALAWRQVFDRRLRPLNLTPTQVHAAGVRRVAGYDFGRPPASRPTQQKWPITPVLTG